MRKAKAAALIAVLIFILSACAGAKDTGHESDDKDLWWMEGREEPAGAGQISKTRRPSNGTGVTREKMANSGG